MEPSESKELYLFHTDNLLPTALITAVVSPSDLSGLIYPSLGKLGNGRLFAVGDYIGSEDREYEIQIQDDTVINKPVVISLLAAKEVTRKIYFVFAFNTLAVASLATPTPLPVAVVLPTCLLSMIVPSVVPPEVPV